MLIRISYTEKLYQRNFSFFLFLIWYDSGASLKRK